ncbi:hypothetical protein L1077_21630 [Pseudoalteromonas luteoviolacea]|uniref:hypothetical protein n=1 Tax=Pseudoalteromonas luteoviolacea TaxID=43657 RepID=UPI001F1E2610|nr:hypothetical protein [Pseudoalteromonas luteoviolacea]MCF6442035.1 hypothetical protein [Pseudoalteromonas luteoviolacea]
MSKKLALRHLNISQMSGMFDLSRKTIRDRLIASSVHPSQRIAGVNVYDMRKAGPAIFKSA